MSAVVDIKQLKHGRFVPGTGHEIVPPDALQAVRPDCVLVMNRMYEAEVRESLANLGLAAEVLTEPFNTAS
jgi:hypothetical protein